MRSFLLDECDYDTKPARFPFAAASVHYPGFATGFTHWGCGSQPPPFGKIENIIQNGPVVSPARPAEHERGGRAIVRQPGRGRL